MKVLHVAAEIFPLVKTGGLADVVGALPQALIEPAPTCACCCPGCPASSTRCCTRRRVCEIGPLFGAGARRRCAAAQMPYSHVPAYVIDAPYLYRRAGSPYQDSDGSRMGRQPAALRAARLGGAHLARASSTPSGRRRCCMRTTGMPRMACAYMACAPGDRRRHRCSRCTTWPSRACSRTTTSRCSACRRASCQPHGAGVPRPVVVHEGRTEVRRPRHHRQPDLRARDRHAGVRLRPGRRDPRPRRATCRASSTASTARCGTRPPTPRSPRATAPRGLPGKARCKAALQARVRPGVEARRAAVRRGQPADVAKGPRPGAVGAAGAAAQRRAAGGAGHRRAGAGSGLPQAAQRAPRAVARAHRLRRERARTA